MERPCLIRGINCFLTLLYFFGWLIHPAFASAIQLEPPISISIIQAPCATATTYPSYSDEEYGEIVFPSDGSFEGYQPLLGRLLEQPSLDPFAFGIVCASDVQATFPEPLIGIDPFNDTVINILLESCATSLDLYDNLPGSNRFFRSFPADSGFDDLFGSIEIEGVVPDPVRPYLQFWVNAKEMEFGDTIDVKAFFRDPNTTTEASLLLGTLKGEDLHNLSCPETNDWFRYTFSMERALYIFEQTQFTAKRFLNLRIDVSGIALIDNVEFVGPRLANDSLYDDRFISIPEKTVPSLLNALAANVFDAIFYITPMMCLVILLILTILPITRFQQFVRILLFIWLFISIAVTAYAVTEYFTFQQDLKKINKETKVIIESFEEAREELNSREVRTKVIGAVPFGFSALVLPKLNQSSLEKVFDFLTPDVRFQEKFCGPGSTRICTESPEEFFNFTKVQPLDSTLRLEAKAEVSQDHFLLLLLSSLIADLATSVAQIALYMLVPFIGKFMSDVGKGRLQRSIYYMNVFIIACGAILSLALIIRVVVEPIRYTVDYALMESSSSAATPVRVLSGLEVLDSTTGKFFIDSSKLGLVTRELEDFDSVGQEPLFLAFAIQREDIYPDVRSGPDVTCDLENIQYNFEDLSYTLDCSDGIIPVFSEKAVKPRIDFAYGKIIYNLVVVDVMITLADLLVFVIERKLSSSEKRLKTELA